MMEKDTKGIAEIARESDYWVFLKKMFAEGTFLLSNSESAITFNFHTPEEALEVFEFLEDKFSG